MFSCVVAKRSHGLLQMLSADGMQDICYLHFALHACPTGASCNLAHDFAQLSNPEQWVMFRARNFIMLDYMPEEYRRHQDFKHYSLPGLGSLVRCGDAETAQKILRDYAKYGNPQCLKETVERHQQANVNAETETKVAQGEQVQVPAYEDAAWNTEFRLAEQASKYIFAAFAAEAPGDDAVWSKFSISPKPGDMRCASAAPSIQLNGPSCRSRNCILCL